MDMNLPLSHEIKKDATLEELEMTKQGWLSMAHQVGYPDMIWEICRWLGVVSAAANENLSDVFLFQNGDVTVFGREDVIKRLVTPSKNCWLYSRRVSVIVKTKEFVPVQSAGRDGRTAQSIERNNANAVYRALFSGEVVMSWEWLVTYDDNGIEDKKENPRECSFVNGNWILSLRNFIGPAQAAKDAHNVKNTDKERSALLSEMLVGVNV